MKKKNSLRMLASLALTASTVICLNIPAKAGDAGTSSKNLYAQSPSSPSNSSSPSSPSNSPSTPTQSGDPKTPSRTQSSPGGGTQTPKSDTQSVRDPNLIPGGWICLNNPNPSCGK